jgi:putative ABC transport system permease protein
MFKNYIVTAWRNIIANPLFSFINIFGLTLGLASCILILLFVRAEVSHDKDLIDGDRIVRLHTAFMADDSPPFLTVRSAGRMMAAISAYAPDLVESGVRLVQTSQTVNLDDAVFDENIILADGSFFDVFALPWKHGSAQQSFARPMDLVISETTALKYFGRTEVVGEVLTVCCLNGQAIEAKITGVISNLPASSHLEIDFLLRMEESMFDFAPNMLATWTSVNTYTYFKLTQGTSAAELKGRIWHWLDTESPFIEMFDGAPPSERFQPNVMPVPDIYLHARSEAGSMGDLKPLGDIKRVYAFICITVLVLILASINFMNLSTARASRRAREVALRKVLGASRLQIALQFLGEALAVTFIALLFALVAVEFSLPFYNEAIGRELEFSLGSELPMLILLLVTTIFVGLVSGSYPAVYLSRFLPARILRSSQSGEESGARGVRNVLVVVQFAASIGLGICTAVIYAQTLYAQNMDVGYSAENKLILHGISRGAVADREDTLTERLLRVPGVTSVVLSSEVPSQDNENNTGFRLLGGATSDTLDDGVVLNYYSVGYDFFSSYQIDLVAGRGFERAFVSDRVEAIDQEGGEIGNGGIVINESAVRRLGLSSPQQAVGRVLRADVFRSGTHDLTIVGVVRDVYFRSLKYGVRSSVFFNNPSRFQEATISFASSAEIPELVADVESIWKELAPMAPINHEFLSAMVRGQYEEEEQQAKLFAAFSLLAVVIACLGLYGLASYTAERRTREIGIRKVLGARVRDIVRLLVWQFSRPVLVANVIAWPVAWLLVQSWLSEFQYRIGTSEILVVFSIACVMSLMIAWCTVAGRALKVARANPIKALRYE